MSPGSFGIGSSLSGLHPGYKQERYEHLSGKSHWAIGNGICKQSSALLSQITPPIENTGTVSPNLELALSVKLATMSFAGLRGMADYLMDDDPNETVLPADFDPMAQPPEGGLQSVWGNFVRKSEELGKPVIRCLHAGCGKTFKGGHNATKALYHVCGVTGKNIAICKGNIPRSWQRAYHDHLSQKMDATRDAANRKEEFYNLQASHEDRVLALQMANPSTSGDRNLSRPPRPPGLNPPDPPSDAGVASASGRYSTPGSRSSP